MRMLKLVPIGPAVTALMCTGLAHANIEPPAAYDARSIGMGSTGVAHVHNGASLFHNPAALSGVEKGALTATFAPLLPQTKAPLAAPPDTQVASERGFFPMFLVGGAYRVHPKLTLGLAAYPTMGFASKYKSVTALGGLEVSAKLAAMEIAPGAAFNLTDDISIGLAYRVTYMSYGAHMPTAMVLPTGPVLLDSKLDVSGWNFLGIQAGAFAKITKTTRLGLTYRNKVPVNMKGNTEIGGQTVTSEVEFAAPHAFKLGVAQALLDDQLLLALDLKLSLYKDAEKTLAVKTPAGTTEMALDWKNTFGVHAGAEYRFAPEGFRARLGYSLMQSATPENRAMPILPPPGLQHAIHAGAGYSTRNFDVDLGGYYLFGSANGAPGAPFQAGDYSMNAMLFGLGGTYRI